ncbi:formyltransferase family protein [uncultured Roseibium sp.]|uniref:formyltransferase family protein n=1 Tax=uncultured Roseibium sp. TaxID=1936171 RepID=UPI00262FE6B1|nr:formyltransferase family protein [uncultured Roseibium sp.]
MSSQAEDWGECIPSGKGIELGTRVLLLASDVPLFACIAAIDEINATRKDPLVLAGVATDAITDPNARISAKKRLWQHYTPDQCAQSYERTRSYCIEKEIAFFSGSIHAKPLQDWLAISKPDIVLSAFYGQLIPEDFLHAPKMGAFNVHPSDTQHGIRGPRPFLDTIEAGLKQENGHLGKVVLHELDSRFDDGRVIVETPGLPFHDCNGVLPANPLQIGFKFCLFAYPVLVKALLETLIDKGRDFPPFQVTYSDDVRAELEHYRYSGHIGYSPASELIQRMRGCLQRNA